MFETGDYNSERLLRKVLKYTENWNDKHHLIMMKCFFSLNKLYVHGMLNVMIFMLVNV